MGKFCTQATPLAAEKHRNRAPVRAEPGGIYERQKTESESHSDFSRGAGAEKRRSRNPWLRRTRALCAARAGRQHGAPEFLEGHVVIVDPGMPLAHGAYAVIDYQGETAFRQYWVEGGRKSPRRP